MATADTSIKSALASRPFSHGGTNLLSIEWWLWPNVLSLDAPLISLVWQRCFAFDAQVSLSPAAQCALPLAVWLIYLLDRLLDTRAELTFPTARHEFYRTHRQFCSFLAFIAAAGLCLSVYHLPERVLAAGLLLAVFMAFYFLQVHAAHRSRISKEMLVGVLFAAGVAVAPLARAAHPQLLLLPIVLFACLCWLNTASIEMREAGRADRVSAWAADHLRPLAVTCAVGGTLILRSEMRHSAIALIVASLAFVCLAAMPPNSLNSRLARVWLDLPLLSPLLFWTWR